MKTIVKGLFAVIVILLAACSKDDTDSSYPVEAVKTTSCDPRIDIKIVNCKRSGSTVVLNYTIENTGMGVDINDFRIYPPDGVTWNSEIIDDKGNKYRLPKVTIGTKSGSEQAVQGMLPLHEKVEASITIWNFNTAATQLSLVKMECLAYPNSVYKLADRFFTFEDVPIY